MAEKSHPSGPNPEGSSRIVWREQGHQRRAYGDFSDFTDVGGARDEPLRGPGMQAATSDPRVGSSKSHRAPERVVPTTARAPGRGVPMVAHQTRRSGARLPADPGGGAVRADALR
jgi:hypothetical protein